MSSVPPDLLLVDDDPLVTHALARIFRTAGYSSRCAHTCGQARSAGPFRLAAVLDLELPDGSGADLAIDLLAANPNAAVVFFTGGAPAATLRRASCRGPVVFKPNVHQLMVEVQTLAIRVGV